MKLHTVWKMWDDDNVEMVFALDEYTVEQNWEAWQAGVDEACKRYKITEGDMRAIIVEVDERLIQKAFQPVMVDGVIAPAEDQS